VSNRSADAVIPGVGDPSGVRLAAAWLGGRLLLMLTVVIVAAAARVPNETHPLRDGNWLLDRFAHWDSYHFIRIAEQGYLPPGLACCDQAFFPGYPILMAGLRPVVGGSTVLAGVVVTLIAGAAAAVSLRAWVRDALGPQAGRRAVWWFAAVPGGVFLTAVYSEAAFLAFAVTAWLAGSRRRWWIAGLLAGAAATVRVNGLFLLAGLAVLYAVQCRTDRRWPGPDVLALIFPLLGVAGYIAYLHHRTGDWWAWQHAETLGWGRHVVSPWRGLMVSIEQIAHAPSGWLVVTRIAEVVAVLLGSLLIVLLARRKRWAEAVYLLPSIGVIACSTLWTSAPRYAITWFPAYLVLAETDLRRAVPRLLFAASLAAEVGLAAVFAVRHWVA
jgi:hypothetical protein